MALQNIPQQFDNENREYWQRKQYLESELMFLFKSKKSRSPEENSKHYTLMQFISQGMKRYDVSHLEEADILMMVYEKALKTIQDQPINYPYGWFKKVALSIIRDMGRKTWGKETLEYQDELTTPSTIHPYHSLDIKDLVEQIFNSLDDLDAQILSLHLYEGYPLREIPQQLKDESLSYEAVRKRYQRIGKRLKKNVFFQQLFQSLFQ